MHDTRNHPKFRPCPYLYTRRYGCSFYYTCRRRRRRRRRRCCCRAVPCRAVRAFPLSSAHAVPFFAPLIVGRLRFLPGFAVRAQASHRSIRSVAATTTTKTTTSTTGPQQLTSRPKPTQRRWREIGATDLLIPATQSPSFPARSAAEEALVVMKPFRQHEDETTPHTSRHGSRGAVTGASRSSLLRRHVYLALPGGDHVGAPVREESYMSSGTSDEGDGDSESS